MLYCMTGQMDLHVTVCLRFGPYILVYCGQCNRMQGGSLHSWHYLIIEKLVWQNLYTKLQNFMWLLHVYSMYVRLVMLRFNIWQIKKWSAVGDDFHLILTRKADSCRALLKTLIANQLTCKLRHTQVLDVWTCI